MPLPLMMPRRLTLATLALLAALPACLTAQETSAREDERMNELLRSDGDAWREPRTRISVGLRVISSGGEVEFGSLGMRVAPEVAPASAGAVDRFYDNGAVGADQLRANEKDADGNLRPVVDGRYLIRGMVTENIVDADGNVTGTQQVEKVVANLLAYKDGQTRNWNAKYEQQYQPHDGYLGFSSYSAISEGGSFTKEQSATGGLELQMSHDFGRLGRRVHWGLTAGVTLNSINGKSSGTVTSTLRTRTDYYKIMTSTRPSMPYATPSSTFLFDEDGDLVNTDGLETTVPLSSVPDETLTETTDLIGGAQVRGNWQIKGAYLMMKVGPTLRTQLTDRFGLIASAGFAGAYAGTRYTVFETFAVPSTPLLEISVDDPVGDTATEFLSGFYADLTLEWLANERTGIFGGVTAQQFGDYQQTLGGRTATIDLGNTVGLRGGVTVRF